MSIEQQIESLTSAVKELTLVIKSMVAPVAAPAPAPVAAPVAVAAPAPAAPAMPPPPSFLTPVEPPKPATPFTDTRGMIQYVTDAYKAMGAQKGARIQEIILSLGVQNINDITPEQYPALYAGIEALKNA